MMHFVLRFICVTLICFYPLVKASTAEENPSDASICTRMFGETYCRTWKNFFKVVIYVMKDCKLKSAGTSKDFLFNMEKCLKNKTITSLDRMLQMNTIPLGGGVEFVRYNSANGSSELSREDALSRQASETGEDWKWQVLDRFAELFKSHVIRVSFDEVTGRRRHYRHLFPLMMFAFMKMLVILVPLGFQFMAVISGKALLLSKMALALASAQAMKKVSSAWHDVYHAPYYHHIHRSYQAGHHNNDHHHHVDVGHGHHAIPLQHNFQSVQHAAPDLTYQYAPQFQGSIAQHQDHQAAPQQFQYVFTDANHQPIHYPPVPSIYDQPVHASARAGDYSRNNGNNNQNYVNSYYNNKQLKGGR